MLVDQFWLCSCMHIWMHKQHYLLKKAEHMSTFVLTYNAVVMILNIRKQYNMLNIYFRMSKSLCSVIFFFLFNSDMLLSIWICLFHLFYSFISPHCFFCLCHLLSVSLHFTLINILVFLFLSLCYSPLVSPSHPVLLFLGHSQSIFYLSVFLTISFHEQNRHT